MMNINTGRTRPDCRAHIYYSECVSVYMYERNRICILHEYIGCAHGSRDLIQSTEVPSFHKAIMTCKYWLQALVISKLWIQYWSMYYWQAIRVTGDNKRFTNIDRIRCIVTITIPMRRLGRYTIYPHIDEELGAERCAACIIPAKIENGKR